MVQGGIGTTDRGIDGAGRSTDATDRGIDGAGLLIYLGVTECDRIGFTVRDIQKMVQREGYVV
jgi:hypothetical protein